MSPAAFALVLVAQSQPAEFYSPCASFAQIEHAAWAARVRRGVVKESWSPDACPWRALPVEGPLDEGTTWTTSRGAEAEVLWAGIAAVTPAGSFVDCLLVSERGNRGGSAFNELVVFAPGAGEILRYAPTAKPDDRGSLVNEESIRIEAVHVQYNRGEVPARVTMKADPNGLFVVATRFAVLARGSVLLLDVIEPRRGARAYLMICEHRTCASAIDIADVSLSHAGRIEVTIPVTGHYWLQVNSSQDRKVEWVRTREDEITYANGVTLRGELVGRTHHP